MYIFDGRLTLIRRKGEEDQRKKGSISGSWDTIRCVRVKVNDQKVALPIFTYVPMIKVVYGAAVDSITMAAFVVAFVVELLFSMSAYLSSIK